ncbi:hypothetical protein ACHAAC_11790 [Aeromicrobium sp. CF4.19]
MAAITPEPRGGHAVQGALLRGLVRTGAFVAVFVAFVALGSRLAG